MKKTQNEMIQMEKKLQIITSQSKQWIETNKPFSIKKKNENEREYYLPVYCRAKIKKITEFDYSKDKCKILATLVMNINYSGLDKIETQNLTKILKQNLLVDINGQIVDFSQSNKLCITIKPQDPRAGFLGYTYRGQFDIEVVSETFYTPFEKVLAWFKVSVKAIKKFEFKKQDKPNDQKQKDKQNRIYTIKFNMMDYQNENSGIRIAFQGKSKDKQKNQIYGNYNIDKNNLGVQYTMSLFENNIDPPSSLKDLQNYRDLTKNYYNNCIQQLKAGKYDKNPKTKDINPFQDAIFRFEFQRSPHVDLLNIFIPLFILAGINLAIFFQQISFGSRIAAIATLILAYINFIPTFRQKIPPSSSFTMVQYIIYALMSTSIICLFGSFRIAGLSSKKYKFDWSKDYYFLICLGIDVVTFFFLISIYYINKLSKKSKKQKKQKKLDKINQSGQESVKQSQGIKFIPQVWKNQLCDQYFNRYKSLLCKKDKETNVDQSKMGLDLSSQKKKNK